MGRSSTDRRHFVTLGILVILATVILNFLLNLSLPFPVAASVEAVTIDRVFQSHILLISFFFSLVVVTMLYAFVVFRRSAGDTGDGEHFEGNTTLEIAWTVIPLLIVILFGVIGVRTLNSITAKGDDEVVIKINGLQWSWNFEYAEGFTSDELVLPLDQRVQVQMESPDVLHSFWIPEFRVKQDLVPGQMTHLRFTPSLAGEYQLRCAELCGVSHWSMTADVRVLERAEYDQWISEMAAAASPALAVNDDNETGN